MKWSILLTLLMLVSFASAEALGPDTGHAKLRISMSKDIKPDGVVSYANFTSYDFPQSEDAQAVSLLSGEGFVMEVGAQGNARLVKKWENTDVLKYGFQVAVETNPRPPLELPVSLTIPPHLQPYLATAEYTKATPEIETAVRTITANVTDKFEKAVLLADWVHKNIKYDLSYGNVVLPAEQVFSQRRGTCDEFSHLFISMARSAGLPARYVSGIVYGTLGTSASGKQDWYNHGWAEVWLGRWVPFDPTYGQFGYVDGTHVKFAAVFSQKDLESRLEWMPDTVTISVGDLDYKVDVDSAEAFSEPLQKIEVYPIGNVSEGQPVTVRAKATGSLGCIAANVVLSHHPDFKPVNKTDRLVFTCPGDEKELEWTLIPPKLDEGFTYTYDVAVSNGLSESRQNMTFSKPKLVVAPEAEVQQITGFFGRLVAAIRDLIRSLLARF